QQQGKQGERRREATRGEPGDEARGGVGPHGVEAAVGDVEDLQDPEDERQAQRDDEQPRRVGDAVDEDSDRCVYLFILEKFNWKKEKLRALGAGKSTFDPIL